MIVYTFKIHSLTKKTVNSVLDTVTSVVWEKKGVDSDNYSGSFKICTNLDTDRVGISTNYILYENLTKSEVMTWIQSVEDMNNVNETIEQNIQKSRELETIVTNGSLPWDPVPEIPAPVVSDPLTPEQIAEAENDMTDNRAGIGTT